MENDMQKKATVLLIAPSFFGYAKEIQDALARRDIVSLWYADRPGNDTMTKALVRLSVSISPKLLMGKADRYFNSIIQEAKNHDIKEILVIKGEALSVNIIKRFRAAFPLARLTLYFWDSYKNMPPDSRDKVPLFDRAFTFDPVDAKNEPLLVYRPLFYLDEYANLPEVRQDIDLFFFGTIHSDRYKILCKLEHTLPAHIKVKKILYFPSHFIYWMRRIFDPSFKNVKKTDFIFEPIGKDELRNLLARSRTVIDIERPIQSGLTMRTIETVGAHKKLITTNPFAENSDIFKPSNVLVIDRENVAISSDFFDQIFEPLDREIEIKYSMDGWIDEVLFWREELVDTAYRGLSAA